MDSRGGEGVEAGQVAKELLKNAERKLKQYREPVKNLQVEGPGELSLTENRAAGSLKQQTPGRRCARQKPPRSARKRQCRSLDLSSKE
jgi:hypothetical protein